MSASYFQRQLPPELRAEWAAEIARAPLADSGREGVLRLLVARVGGDWLGFPPHLIASTLPVAGVRRIPHRANGTLEGLFNADGRVVVCVNLEHLLKTSADFAADASARMLILQWRRTQVAVRVRAVLGLEELDLSTLQMLRDDASASLAGISSGVAVHRSHPVVCLDAGRLVAALQGAIE